MSEIRFGRAASPSTKGKVKTQKKQSANSGVGVSEKSMVPAALLCFFLGGFGFHRFYVGKIGTGILMLLTLGGLGIWSIIDFVRIIVGSFEDKNGLPLQRN